MHRYDGTMRFATRSDFESTLSLYGDALERARLRPGFIDLTLSNPTRCGFDYTGIDLAELSHDSARRYDADTLGMRSAREAVAGLYAASVDPDRVLLTASTSEAYSYLLRLLCEPGDAVLVPSPSYPLFDLLARLHDVDLQQYPLVYHDGWLIDPSSLAEAVTPKTRAIVVIHPNNPTGHYSSAADRAVLFALAASHGLPLIVDEVFLDYGVESAGEPSFAVTDPPVPTFVLGGLSKLLAMPQMKLAWMVACGPADEVTDAMRRLEVIADTFLSVGAPVQTAFSAWLGAREVLQGQIRSRVAGNLRELDDTIAGSALSRLRVDGGWSVVLRVPAVEDDEELAIRLLGMGIAVHPGSFYGFSPKGWLVVSLLVDSASFAEGVRRVCGIFAEPSLRHGISSPV